MQEVRLIDANALLKKCIDGDGDNKFTEGYNFAVQEISAYIALAPTIEPEVRHAEWDCIDDDGGVYRCSACGEAWYLEAGTPKENNMNYCPTCGAKMDGGDDNGG